MIGPRKLADKTYAASVARMNLAHKANVGNKLAKPRQAIPFLFELLWKMQVWNCLVFNDHCE